MYVHYNFASLRADMLSEMRGETGLRPLRTPLKKDQSSQEGRVRGKFDYFMAAGTPSRNHSFATPASKTSTCSTAASASPLLLSASPATSSSGWWILIKRVMNSFFIYRWGLFHD
jgi:hypothetical protein